MSSYITLTRHLNTGDVEASCFTCTISEIGKKQNAYKIEKQVPIIMKMNIYVHIYIYIYRKRDNKKEGRIEP